MRLFFLLFCLSANAFGPANAWVNHARFFGGYEASYGQPTAILPDGTGWSIGHVTPANDLRVTLFWDGTPGPTDWVQEPRWGNVFWVRYCDFRAIDDGIRWNDQVRRTFWRVPPPSIRMQIYMPTEGEEVLVYSRIHGLHTNHVANFRGFGGLEPGYIYVDYSPDYGDSGSLIVSKNPVTGGELLVGLLASTKEEYFWNPAHPEWPNQDVRYISKVVLPPTQ